MEEKNFVVFVPLVVKLFHKKLIIEELHSERIFETNI
jgi:hypothetical protein